MHNPIEGLSGRSISGGSCSGVILYHLLGSIPAPDKFIAEVRRIASEHSTPLIVDEIQAGMCRTGKVWACEHSGTTPDIMTISKGIGGGLPLSVVAFDKKLDTWEKGAHIGTFRGHIVAMAAAVTFYNQYIFFKNYRILINRVHGP